MSTKSESILAISPLSYLNQTSEVLLEPSNLHYLAEYYLLENLAAGLVSENWKNIDSWEGQLAENWVQKSPKTWIFKIKKNLKWSDGSFLTIKHIADHFRLIQSRKSRHLTLAKKIQEIKENATSNTLTFVFESPVDEGLLHELSLSEARILHKKNLSNDWSITSGPYYVKKIIKDAVFLQSNRNFIKKIEIENVEIRSAPYPYFDIRKRPMYSFREEIEKVVKKSSQIKLGFPTYIYYFYFNPNNPLAKSKDSRIRFSKYLKNVFENFEGHGSLKKMIQMIPEGYSGHLEKVQNHLIGEVKKSPLKIDLCIKNHFKLVDIPKLLQNSAKNHNIDLELFYEKPPEGIEPFAVFNNFVGNQRDPLSSWRFLYGEGGPLHMFYPEVEDLFEKISQSSGEERKNLLLELHRKTLEEAYAVPFLAEYDAMLASDRVDLSDINPFDMRLRFFEMKWKK